MFQTRTRDKLLSTVSINFALAITIIALPTAILLAVIGTRAIRRDGDALLVDLSLGAILVWSSLAAILAPLIYRPVSVLYATYLAKAWISASADGTYKSSAFLPSTPQYLLAVGNLGNGGLVSMYNSVKYYYRRRTGMSPVFTQSAICLAGLILAAVMVAVADVWIHLASTADIESSLLSTTGLHNFSKTFAPPATSAQAPWRLQQGLQTFLDVSTTSTVVELNDTLVVVPRDIPDSTSVSATTIGMGMTCDLVNSQCTFNQSAAPLSFDCSSVEAGAFGPISDTVNVTQYPSGNSTSFTYLASMALPSLFNQTNVVLAAQVFRCSGSLQNVTYYLDNGRYSISASQAIEPAPLDGLWQLDSFPGKREIISSAMDAVGKSTIWVQGINVTSIPEFFSAGLSRLMISFLAGETVPSQSLKESPMSSRLVSRIPLAPIIVLSAVIGLIILAITFIGFRAILSAMNPPLLNGNPISITNLHRQLTSPMDVLASSLGNAPLAMKVLFNGQDEGRVHFDVVSSRPNSEAGGDTIRKEMGGDDISFAASSRYSDDYQSSRRLQSSRRFPVQEDETERFTNEGARNSRDGGDLSDEEGRLFVGMEGRREGRRLADERARADSARPVTPSSQSTSLVSQRVIYISPSSTPARENSV